MTDNRDDGGPAFPFEYHNQTSRPQPAFFQDGFINPDGAQQFAGMTMRDGFAGQALAASGLTADAKLTAEWAYLYADAMLEERKK